MNKTTEAIFRQAVDEVYRKYRAEAIYEAEQKVRENTKKDIAKKLKGIISPEEISRVTGLSFKTIDNL